MNFKKIIFFMLLLFMSLNQAKAMTSVVEYKDNLWKIEINSNILIPNSYTSIDRLIRFINYGDNVCAGTGMFTKLEQEYGHHQLNAIWNYFIIKELGHPAQSKIIAR